MDIVKVALKEYATHGYPGGTANARILQYFREVGRPEWKSDEIPWCAVFINWCLVQIGLPTCGRGLAESFATYGTPTNKPELGDIVVFEGTKNGDKVNHVGIFIRNINGLVYVLGGNQANEVNITAFAGMYVSEYRKLPQGIAPDDPRNKYNTATGKLNPNYTGHA